MGLASALYPAADELQHGNLTRVADLITTFVGAAPSELRLKLDGGGQMIVEDGHVVLVANMPYLGASFHLSSDILCDDGLLDVFVFGGVGKLDLINYAVRAMSGGVDDPRVTHYQATTVDVEEVPPMPVMADGEILGHGSLRVTIRPRSLAVMTGQVSP